MGLAVDPGGAAVGFAGSGSASIGLGIATGSLGDGGLVALGESVGFGAFDFTGAAGGATAGAVEGLGVSAGGDWRQPAAPMRQQAKITIPPAAGGSLYDLAGIIDDVTVDLLAIWIRSAAANRSSMPVGL
jgi:hypothetical protein